MKFKRQKYHQNAINLIFRYVDKKKNITNTNIPVLLAEVTAYNELSIIEVFLLAQERYKIDYSETINDLLKFYRYEELE